MSEPFDFAKFLILNGERLTIVVVLLLVMIGLGALWLTDRLVSPSEVKRLREQCAVKEVAVQKATAELGDSRVLNAKAETALTYQSERIEELERERDQCRRQLERKEIEAEVRQRFLPTPQPEIDP